MQPIPTSEAGYGGDGENYLSESYFDSLSRSIEMSYLLKSRSPWIAVETVSQSLPTEEQRARSISFASSSCRFGDESRGLLSDRSVNINRDGGSNRESALSDFQEAQMGAMRMESDGSLPLMTPSGLSSTNYMDGSGKILPLPEDAPSLSSLGQSIFNATNLLMGVGLLSLPFALRLSGWAGLLILFAFSCITNYTAKLLGKIMDYTPSVKLRDGPGAYTMYGFHDMGYVVFGSAGRIFISFIFLLETFGYACVFLIVEGENLQHLLGPYSLFATWQREHFMVLSCLVFLPTVWIRNLSVLSYLSALGVFSSLVLVIGVLTTGADSDFPPNPSNCYGNCTGSFLNPSPTSMVHPERIPMVLGLIMVGFAGHAIMPTIRNDMANKKDYDKMIDWTYVIVSGSYMTMAALGYLMYGDQAQQQVTLNLGRNIVAQATIWIVVLNPVSKYALDIAPIALGLEHFLQIAYNLPPKSWFFALLSVIVRTMLVALSLFVVVAVPHFAMVLGVMGSACAFTISVAFPCWCYATLFGSKISNLEKYFNVCMAVLGTLCAIVGTVAAILDPSARA